jgi:hypothetical protein
LILAACASSPPAQHPGSRGPRASEHLSAAAQHTEEAEHLARWPDRLAGSAEAPVDKGGWYRAWDTVADELRMARHHQTAATQILAEYDEACGQRSHAEVSVSPLERYAVGGEPTERGATVFLSVEAGSPDQLMADMRCHRAWMMIGRTNMESCPLDLAGLRVAAHGDSGGITVEMTVDDLRLVAELQRRVAHDLESSAQHRR